MKHFLPFFGGLIGWAIGTSAFPGSAPDNQLLFGLLAGGFLFLILGAWIWVLPTIPPPTREELEYRAWEASWTPPPPPVYYPQRDLHAEHQQHLQDQARYLWLGGDRNIPPGDWYA
jgi:hypothetical protein